MRAALMVWLALTPQEGAQRMVRNTAYARVDVARGIAWDATVRQAIEAKNAAAESRQTISLIDEQWTAGGQSDLKRDLTGNACAERLREMIADDALIVEAIVMDRQGALVCSSGPTSDYDQSDEPKWQETVSEGRAVFVDEPAYDESTDTFAIQLSVSVKGDAAPAGAVTLTLRLASPN